MVSSTLVWEDEETEIHNDNGFVYKRRKRRRTLEEEAEAASTANDQLSEADLQPQLKKRKLRTLRKLKAKYQNEILHWEQLSNTYRALEQTAQQSQQARQLQQAQLQEAQQPSSSSSSDLVSQLDELIRQVEVQEMIVREATVLCDTAEAYARAEEERRKKQFLDLPVWDLSPRRLITSLCEDDDGDEDCNDNDNANDNDDANT